MSKAIERADKAEDEYMAACVGRGGGDSEERIRVVLDAALNVEEMARVLEPDDWRLHDDPRYDHLPQGARDSLTRKSLIQAAAIRELVLGGDDW